VFLSPSKGKVWWEKPIMRSKSSFTPMKAAYQAKEAKRSKKKESGCKKKQKKK